MKIIAYTALLYGSEYLAYAIRSVIDDIDEYHVLYTAQGSHGHRTPYRCPDNREDLRMIAYQAAGEKLRWHEGVWAQEGQHRDAIHEIVPGADVILVLDSDEVWGEGLAAFILLLIQMPTMPEKRFRLPIVHYWRSFRRCIIHDPAFPIRVICPKRPESTRTITAPENPNVQQPINHFGYAIRPELMHYKWQVHGHKNEMRRDCNWYVDKFLVNAQRDCHPVGSEYWNPETVNPLDWMPAFMQEHPYFHKDVIE